MTQQKAKKSPQCCPRESAIFTNANELQKYEKQILAEKIPNTNREITAEEKTTITPITLRNQVLFGNKNIKLTASSFTNSEGTNPKKNGVFYFSVNDNADRKDVVFKTNCGEINSDYLQKYLFVIYFDPFSSKFRLKVNIESWDSINTPNYIFSSLLSVSYFPIRKNCLLNLNDTLLKLSVLKQTLEISDWNADKKWIFHPDVKKTVRISNREGDDIFIAKSNPSVGINVTYNNEDGQWVLDEQNKAFSAWVLAKESMIWDKGTKLKIGNEIIDVI